MSNDPSVLDIPHVTNESILESIAACLCDRRSDAYGQDAEYWFDILNNRDGMEMHRLYGQWLEPRVTFSHMEDQRSVANLLRDHVDLLLSKATPEQLEDWT